MSHATRIIACTAAALLLMAAVLVYGAWDTITADGCCKPTWSGSFCDVNGQYIPTTVKLGCLKG